MSTTTAPATGATRVARALGPVSVARALGPASWIVVLLGGAVTVFLPGPADGAPIRLALVITLGIFFVLLLARLLLVAALRPDRRLSLLLLAAGVGLWAAGSATVSAEQTTAVVTFPAPGEVLCLASYLGLAAFLLLDVPRRQIPAGAIWLEAAVVCGGAVCLAAFAVLTPLAGVLERDGFSVLLAILYPLLDLVLGTLVLAQLMLGQRRRSARTLLLTLGFLGLAAADASFISSIAGGTYSSNILLDALWGFSFAAIVSGACVPSPPAIVAPRIERQHFIVAPAAAALALAVLVLHPAGVIGWCVMVPAIVTMICTGARMILALKEAQGAAEATHLSLTDELTGLPNRRALAATVDDALASGAPLGVMLLDLDGFKDINDSLGHLVGDEVLTTLARRMRAQLDPSIVVARLGGDEFALVVLSDDEAYLLELAETLRSVLKAPLRVDSFDLSIDGSIGITVRRATDGSSTELLRRADIAMYGAKGSRAGARLFDSSQDGFSRERLRRGDELRQAIAMGDQIEVWYQPQVDARTHQIVAMEALVRWRHPIEGLLSPISFLAEARRSGLMAGVTDVVMRQVLAAAQAWKEEGFDFRVAMNCAPPELVDGRFLPSLFAALDLAGLSGDALIIEVTEDSFLADPDRARNALSDLRAHQVQTSIDDYGTGFSSLAYLRDLPVQELKIDRTFVSTVVHDERSRMIVQTTAQMAHAMGLRLVAEGVEDAETVAVLLPLGVDVLQGYHVARPMPADDVGPWVRRWSTSPPLPVPPL